MIELVAKRDMHGKSVLESRASGDVQRIVRCKSYESLWGDASAAQRWVPRV